MTGRIPIALFALALLVPMAASARAQEVTQADLMVAARTIGFIQNLPHGTVTVGIVYDPGVAQSEQRAREIDALFGDGLRSGNFLLKPVLLPLNKLQNITPDLYFLTEGADTAAAQVSRASRARKIPCITFDLEKVRNGTCTIGVRAKPRIQIIVNHAAAEASHTELSAVFRFMITEL